MVLVWVYKYTSPVDFLSIWDFEFAAFFLSARNLVLSFSSYAMSAAILSKEVQVWDLGGGQASEIVIGH